jgi:hypothetical protein
VITSATVAGTRMSDRSNFLIVATSKFSYRYIPYYKNRPSSYEHLSPILSRLRCESDYFPFVSNPLLTSYW